MNETYQKHENDESTGKTCQTIDCYCNHCISRTKSTEFTFEKIKQNPTGKHYDENRYNLRMPLEHRNQDPTRKMFAMPRRPIRMHRSTDSNQVLYNIQYLSLNHVKIIRES